MPINLARLSLLEGNPSASGPIPANSKPQTKEVVKEERPLINKRFNNFCRLVNGETDPENHNYKSLRDITKAIWPVYLPLQIFGLFNDRAAKLAKAWYGACWSIIYSCYRPWQEDRIKLGGNKAKPLTKSLYKANEYFRMVAGSLVSAIYGSGAFGMLWGALTGKDEFFDKSYEVYKTGMFNQNPIFASMNAEICMARENNIDQLKEVHKEKKGVKSNIEKIDSVLFLPNIITRALDTLRLFGLNLGSGVQRAVNTLAYFSYGTWAARFGILKSSEQPGSDLERPDKDYEGMLKSVDNILHETQKHGGEVFTYLQSGISWLAALAELFGFGEAAEKIFKLEGIAERLNPAIASWCVKNPWFMGYLKQLESHKGAHQGAKMT